MVTITVVACLICFGLGLITGWSIWSNNNSNTNTNKNSVKSQADTKASIKNKNENKQNTDIRNNVIINEHSENILKAIEEIQCLSTIRDGIAHIYISSTISTCNRHLNKIV